MAGIVLFHAVVLIGRGSVLLDRSMKTIGTAVKGVPLAKVFTPPRTHILRRIRLLLCMHEENLMMFTPSHPCIVYYGTCVE